jgi:hypothetical protein
MLLKNPVFKNFCVTPHFKPRNDSKNRARIYANKRTGAYTITLDVTHYSYFENLTFCSFFKNFYMSISSLKITTQIFYPDVNRCFNFQSTKPTASCQMPGLFVEVCFWGKAIFYVFVDNWHYSTSAQHTRSIYRRWIQLRIRGKSEFNRRW